MSHLPLVVLLTIAVAPGATAGEVRRCFETWSEAAEIVANERLVAIERLSGVARARLGGDIVRTTLCDVGNRYIYRLVVRPASGRLKIISIDARRPFDTKPSDR
jgi:hypothetical protein